MHQNYICLKQLPFKLLTLPLQCRTNLQATPMFDSDGINCVNCEVCQFSKKTNELKHDPLRLLCRQMAVSSGVKDKCECPLA